MISLFSESSADPSWASGREEAFTYSFLEIRCRPSWPDIWEEKGNFEALDIEA